MFIVAKVKVGADNKADISGDYHIIAKLLCLPGAISKEIFCPTNTEILNMKWDDLNTVTS